MPFLALRLPTYQGEEPHLFLNRPKDSSNHSGNRSHFLRFQGAVFEAGQVDVPTEGILEVYRSLSDIDRSTMANDPQPSASFSARKNPQCIPANTLPVFSGLRPCIWPRLLRLVTKAMSDRLLAVEKNDGGSLSHYPFKRGLAGCEKPVVGRETGGTGETDGGSRSEVRGFQNVEPRTSNFASRISRMSRVSRAIVGGGEVGNDESRVGDWVYREGGCVLIGHRGAQSLGRLTDEKRERLVLLNLPEMGHRIPAPSWNQEPRQPCFGGASHGTSGTDSRLPVVTVLSRCLGCREFLFNQRCRCHHAKSFQWLTRIIHERFCCNR